MVVKRPNEDLERESEDISPEKLAQKKLTQIEEKTSDEELEKELADQGEEFVLLNEN